MLKTLLALAAVVAVGAIVVSVSTRSPVAEISVPPSKGSDTGGTSASRQPASAPSEPGFRWTEAETLARARHLRQEFDRMRQATEPRTRAHATMISHACSQFARGPNVERATERSPQSIATGSREQREARAQLSQRCSGFASMSLKEVINERRSIERDLIASSVPLIETARLNQLVVEPDRIELAKDLARRILDSGDPIALSQMRDAMAAIWDRNAQNESPNRVDPNEAAIAWTIMSCRLGLPCDKDSLFTIRACAEFAMCADDLVDAQLAPLAPDVRQRVLRRADALERALSTRNFGALGL